MAFYSESYFEPDCSIGYLARRAFQLSSLGLDPVFEPEAITLTQWSALVSIHFDRGNTCAELARDLAHDKGATTRLVDTLVDKNWVTRTRHPDDRRVINLALTAAGEEVARRCRSRVIDCWNEWLIDWEPTEAAELVRLLQKLRDTLHQRIAPGAAE
jgi:DNA-binding MarR family transcriptional regulator